MYTRRPFHYQVPSGKLLHLVPHFTFYEHRVKFYGCEMYNPNRRFIGYWPAGDIPVDLRTDILRFIRENKGEWSENYPA